MTDEDELERKYKELPIMRLKLHRAGKRRDGKPIGMRMTRRDGSHAFNDELDRSILAEFKRADRDVIYLRYFETDDHMVFARRSDEEPPITDEEWAEYSKLSEDEQFVADIKEAIRFLRAELKLLEMVDIINAMHLKMSKDDPQVRHLSKLIATRYNAMRDVGQRSRDEIDIILSAMSADNDK